MNCANHPDLPVSAYCQNCGKPLCTQCMRSVAGVVYCEPCLAARLNPSSPYNAGAPASASGAAPGSAGSANWTSVPGSAAYTGQGFRSSSAPSPVLAGFLGLIPGVGAMYNGQFVKAFAHVIVFVILISISDHFDAAGILVAAWIFYQVFDAAQTAIARRDGRPLPDPFGLNDLGQRLGIPGGYAAAPVSPTAASAQASPQAWAGAATETPTSQVPGSEIPAPPYGVPQASAAAAPDWEAYAHRVAAAQAEAETGVPFSPGAYNPGVPAPPVAPVIYGGRPEPIGAIVLVGVGTLFLLSTLGVFQMRWIGHFWPVLIILLGAWLLFRRVRTTPRIGGGL